MVKKQLFKFIFLMLVMYALLILSYLLPELCTLSFGVKMGCRAYQVAFTTILLIINIKSYKINKLRRKEKNKQNIGEVPASSKPSIDE